MEADGSSTIPTAVGSRSAPTRRRPGRRRRWRWFLLTVALLVLVIRSMLPETLGEQARRSVEAKLSAHYSHLDIRIRSGRYVTGKGLVLEDIVVAAPAVTGGSTPLLKVARVVAETNLDWQRISDGEFPMTASRMVVSGVEANLWSDADGNFSIEQLLPLPQLGPGCPLVVIHDARVRLIHDPREPDRSMQWHHIEARIAKTPSLPGGAIEHRIEAVATSSDCQQLSVQAVGGPAGWTVRGAAKELRIDAARLDRLPRKFEKLSTALSGLNCIGNAEFTLRTQPQQPLQWQVQGGVEDGRFEHPHLALTAQKISGRFTLGHQGAAFEEVQAYVDGALFRGNATLDELRWPCDLRCNLAATNLLLDQRLAAALPQSMRAKWDRIQPRGLVDVSAAITHQANRWSTSATVQSKGVNVRFDRFPYPVRDLNGTIQFEDGVVHCNELFGTVDGQPMRCQMRLAPRDSGVSQWFRASVDGSVAINDALVAALTPRNELPTKLETFVRSLSPTGGVRVAAAEIQIDPDGHKSQRIDLRFEDAQLRYEEFPYPLYGVNGQVIVEDDTTRLVNFVAENGDAASIHCDGTYRVTPAGGELGLQFVGRGVPLDRTLRAALPASSQLTWDALAPVGVLEQIAVSVTKTPDHATPQLEIAASLGATPGVSQNTVSVRPNALPYRMDLVSGKVLYADGQVRLEQLDGRHDGTRLAANGTCIESKDGRWRLDLNVLSGSRMTVDAELISSLPPEVQGVCQRLQLRGPLGLRGTTSLLLPNDDFPQPESRFDLSIQMEGNRIGDVGPVRDLRGELAIRGQQNVDGVTADGTAQLDSMHYQGIQLTGVHGPFAIRGDQLLLGAINPALPQGENFQPVAGNVFGGQFTLSGTLGLATSQYDLFVSLADADVPALLSDFQQPNSDMTGRLSGEVQLEGAVGAAHLLKGVGQAQLSGANLYQMPQIVQLLTQLRVTPGEDVAFTDGKSQFTLSGDQIAFSQLQLWGDLVALHGSGTISRLRDLNLTFNTRVSPQNSWSRLIRPLDSQRYTLWTISVQGPIDAPTIERRTLDGVSETLERLFPGMGLDNISQKARSTFGKTR